MESTIRLASLSRISRLAGGIFYSARWLAQSLREAGLDVRAYGPDDVYAAADVREWDPVPVYAVPAISPNGFAYCPRLTRMLTQFDPHIVHVHGIWNYDLPAAAAWCAKHRRPLVVSPRGTLDPWALQSKRLKKKLARLAYVDRCLRNAARLHSLCDSETQAIENLRLGVPVFQSPNGMNLPPPDDSRDVSEAPTPRVLLFLSRLNEKKGVGPLIDAWSAACRSPELDNWKLVIAGWGEPAYGPHAK